MLLSRLILGTWLLHLSLSVHTEDVDIITDHVVEEIDDYFVGVCIDSSVIRGYSSIDTLRSPKLLNYVQALTPAYLRIGGTNGDSMTFDLTATKIRINNGQHILPGTLWDAINIFSHKSGLKLIFGFNELLRKGDEWDSTNAEAILHYSSQKGYSIPGFELGNEPNLYFRHPKLTVNVTQLGADFQAFKRLLQSTTYKNSLVLGPDTGGYREPYLRDFLSNGGSVVDVITYHSYYMHGETAKVSDFTHLGIIDHIKHEIVAAAAVANQQHPRKVAWIGETSSGSGGGAVNISDRYIAGHMWLDKLGLSARYGLKGVMRQTLYGGHYGILNKNLDPNPDYWLTVVYKRLVGNKVFRLTNPSPHIQVYAHCTKRNNQYNYKPGSLTVYALNLNTDPIILQFPHLQGQHHLDVFWLTPEKGDPKAERVQLNGKTLMYTNDKLPSMTPMLVTSGSVTAPGKTFGFIVMPDANIAACKAPDHGTIIG